MTFYLIQGGCASGMLAPMLGGWVIAQGFGYVGVFCAAAITATSCGLSMVIDGVRVIMRKRAKTKGKNK